MTDIFAYGALWLGLALVATLLSIGLGQSVFRRWLMGSVSRRVMSYATCTVTVVR